MVNAGVSRETSAQARARLDRALDGDVRILVVALGANDGLRGVPVAGLAANLSHIIEVAQKRGIAVLLCGMEALPIHGWAYTIAFHQAYMISRRSTRFPLIPFILLNIIGNPALMQADRAHPNAEGARATPTDLAVWNAFCRPPLSRTLRKAEHLGAAGPTRAPPLTCWRIARRL